ncbi:MAG: peptidase C15 [Proteobacteria bacterium]|nr:peptidase C15 [Pseudomonadota bacterium]
MADAILAAMRHDGEIGPNDEAMLDWLITGFGPFPRVPRNPAQLLAQKLGAGWRFRHVRAAFHVFETAYASVEAEVRALAASRPQAVLMLGVAARTKAMRVELRAVNRRASGARDARKALPPSPVIAPGGPVYRAGRHKGGALVQRLRAAGVAAGHSRDAGRYLCNFAYWHMLGALPEARVVFIHISMPNSGKKGDRRASMGQMERALRAMMRGGL